MVKGDVSTSATDALATLVLAGPGSAGDSAIVVAVGGDVASLDGVGATVGVVLVDVVLDVVGVVVTDGKRSGGTRIVVVVVVDRTVVEVVVDCTVVEVVVVAVGTVVDVVEVVVDRTVVEVVVVAVGTVVDVAVGTVVVVAVGTVVVVVAVGTVVVVVAVGTVVVVVGEVVFTTSACAPAMLLAPLGTLVDTMLLPAVSCGAVVNEYD